MKCYYHTRHIPREHLRLDDPWGKAVENNRLCDTLDEPVISEMQKYHIDIIETRAVWAEIEKEEGVLDFSAVRERVDKIRQAGIGVGIFPWFQHPPAWKKDATRLQCLEHGKESTLISLWDPELLKIYDRLYGALAAEFRDEIDFLYVGVYGDYGEVFFPHGVTHYKFSPPHGHPGLYCGDVLARADWKNYLKAKYRTLPALCTAWAEDIGSFDENLMQFSEYFSPEDRVERIYINFCNPWPKGKHKKRRLTHPRQLQQYRTVLDGEIWFKTDDDELFEESILYFQECGFDIVFQTTDLHKEPDIQSFRTEHEAMFEEMGKTIKFLIARPQQASAQ